MFTFNHIEADYSFSAKVTFADGHVTLFSKKDHVEVNKRKDVYLFTMHGSSDEKLNGKDPDEFDAVVLELGKALYPIDLRVSEEGEFLGVDDFEALKNQWEANRKKIIDFYNSYLVEKESNRYALAFDSEEKFFNILKKNMLYRLLFWLDKSPNQEVEIRDFPARARLAIFTFPGGIFDGKGWSYDTYSLRDEGSGRLLSGHAKLTVMRGADGLPDEIVLKARVEEQDTGYFSKEVTLKRL